MDTKAKRDQVICPVSHRWLNSELRITVFDPVISKGMPFTSKFSHSRTTKLLLKNSDIYLKVFGDFLD